MLLRTVRVPDTRSANINSLAVHQVSVVSVLSWNNLWIFNGKYRANKEKSSDWGQSCFIWRSCGAKRVFVCVAVWAGVMRVEVLELESLLWRCSEPQLLVLSNTREVFQGQWTPWSDPRGDPGVLVFSKMNKLFYWHESLQCTWK